MSRDCGHCCCNSTKEMQNFKGSSLLTSVILCTNGMQQVKGNLKNNIFSLCFPVNLGKRFPVDTKNCKILLIGHFGGTGIKRKQKT